MPQQEDESIWLEWREDAESTWAEVYGVCDETGAVYPGDMLILFTRAFGVWYSADTPREFKNARSMKSWVTKLFNLCGKKPNEFRNNRKFYERILEDSPDLYRT